MHKLQISILFLMLITFVVSSVSANNCSLSDSLKNNNISISVITPSFSILQKVREGQRNRERCDTIFNLSSIDTACFLVDQKVALVSTTDSISNNQKKKRRLAALCAFPFPFGFVAGHRVMLGTKPWVPVVYVATFGGCFGLLSLIDFCVILFSKDITQYENNPNIFMWLK